MKVTFWDLSGKGDFKMFAAVKNRTAVTIYDFEFDIDWSNKVGILTRDENNTSLFVSSTAITTLETSDDFLIIGCATCENG
jgi:hypothetical protein